jgi:hypothetical protein
MKRLPPLFYRRLFAIAYPLAGVVLIGVGAWQVYPPAGLIAVGALLILDTYHSARKRGTK